jgi:hypothetical protein
MARGIGVFDDQEQQADEDCIDEQSKEAEAEEEQSDLQDEELQEEDEVSAAAQGLPC